MKIKKIILFCLLFLSVSSAFSFTRTINIQVIKIMDGVKPGDLYGAVYKAGMDSHIDGILLGIDHHGGEIGSFSAVADMIEEVNKKKPVISFVMGSADSMGYAMAASAGFIITHSMSEVGAIGVIYTSFKDEELTRKTKEGINAGKVIPIVIAVGKYKGTFSRYSNDHQEDQREWIQKLMQSHYEIFTKKIAEKRKLNISKVTDWADGKLFTADQALKLGLIDKIGTITDVTKEFKNFFTKRFPKENWEQYGVNYIES